MLLELFCRFPKHRRVYTDGSKEDKRTAMSFVCDDHEFSCRINDEASICTAELLAIDNHIITKYQCGFQKGKSTTDHLVRLETYIRQGFVKNQHTVGVFFDLEKAYDTTWKGGIMKDLHEMGLKGRLPLFIDNFLKGRKFKVRLDNTHSSLNPQEEGVPQGSILSPTLFTPQREFSGLLSSKIQLERNY